MPLTIEQEREIQEEAEEKVLAYMKEHPKPCSEWFLIKKISEKFDYNRFFVEGAILSLLEEGSLKFKKNRKITIGE